MVKRVGYRSLKLLVALLIFGSLALPSLRGQTQQTELPAVVLGQSFSLDVGSPSLATGLHPADILGAGGLVLIACENLGLVCMHPSTGDLDNITGMSFGEDFSIGELPPWQFSVGTGSRGASGAVESEANCSPPEAEADVFYSTLDGTNLQALDGDGTACGDNNAVGLYLVEGGNNSDNLNALARDPCGYVDLNCDGILDMPVLLTLGPGSPTHELLGSTANDILVSGIDFVPLIWANGEDDLGLVAGDVIDGLCIQENGNGQYDSEDIVLFSLAPDSPTLVTLAANASDLLLPAPPRVAIPARTLGLAAGDSVNALLCAAEVMEIPAIRDLFLPSVETQ